MVRKTNEEMQELSFEELKEEQIEKDWAERKYELSNSFEADIYFEFRTL